MPPSSTALLQRFVVKAKFRHMQILVKLSELGSMRRVAEDVGMTQPAISLIIAELERLLETELFFRHARGMEPTEITRQLLPVANRVLAALEDGAEIVSNGLEKNNGIVRIAATEAAIGGILHNSLSTFAEKYSGIHLHISQVSGNDPLRIIAEDKCDILCMRRPEVIPKGWVFESFCEDALVAICSSSHKLANIDFVNMEKLGKFKWLLNRVGSIARLRFEEMSQLSQWQKSSRCNVVMHIPELTLKMLLTDKYLAIVPRSVAKPWLDSNIVTEINCDISYPLSPLGFIWKEERAGNAASIYAAHLKMASSEQYT